MQNEAGSAFAVRTVVGINAGAGQAQAIDWTSVDEVLLDNLLGIPSMGKTIPNGFGIDNENSGVFALIKAAGFVDPNAMLETSGFDGILQRAAEFLAIFVGAARAGGGFVALIHTDEQMVFKDWHTTAWMQEGMQEATRGWVSARIEIYGL